ncbi:MAG: AraC family transcriptional regulator, partial [Burkholderiaceae bacterium]
AGIRSLFASDDPQHAEAVVGSVFRPHTLALPRTAAPLHAAMDYLPVGALSLSRLRYGRAVDILPGPLERFYLIQIPLRGHALIDTGRSEFHSHAGCAALLSPQPDLSMRWNDDSDQLILRFDAELVRRCCASWCGDPKIAPPVFDPCLQLDRHPAIGSLLLAIIGLSQQPGPRGDAAGPAHALSALELQNRLLAALLRHQPHSASERLAASAPPLAPRHVRRVEEYLVAHPREEHTPESLADLAGVSVRSLFLGFQRSRGIGPMKLLRELRLHKVRDELLLAASGSGVTEVALAWGFFHLGRFAQEYKALFGESPSRTRTFAARAGA